MNGQCPCGAPALEDGLCGFCLGHSTSVVLKLIRRLRDRLSKVEAKLKRVHGVDPKGNCLACGAYWPGRDPADRGAA